MKSIKNNFQQGQRTAKTGTIVQAIAFASFVLLVNQAIALCSAPSADTTTVLTPPHLSEEGAIHLTQLEATGSYRFGLVRAGTTVQHDFTLRNDTGQTLQLDRIEPSCHCTSALIVLPKLPVVGLSAHLLAPGQSIQVRVNLDTSQIAASETDPQGQVEKTVSVYVVGQPIHPAAVLTLLGRIASSASFDPPLLDLGAMPADQATRRTVRLFFAPANARLATAGDDRLRLRRLGITHAAGNEIQTYQIEVPAHAALGPLSAAITVVGDAASTATLPVMGQINGKVSARPPSIVFGMVSATPTLDITRRTRLVLLSYPDLRSADAGTFWAHTKVIQSPASFWQADLVKQPLPSTSCQFRLFLKPTAPAGRWLTDRAMLVFPDGTRLIIPVAGENAPPTASGLLSTNPLGSNPTGTPTLKAARP